MAASEGRIEEMSVGENEKCFAPTSSVVITAYNGSRFIAEAIESVQGQMRRPDEIIIVDDASTDDTLEIVEDSFRGSQIPTRIIRLPENSGGPARPLNVGLAACRGDVVVLLEQDDRLTPNKIADHFRYFIHDRTAALVFGQFTSMDASGTLGLDRSEDYRRNLEGVVTPVGDGMYRLAHDDAFRLLTRAYLFGGAGGTTITKAAWQQLGGFDEAMTVAWDYDFAFRAAAAGWNIGYTPTLVYYRRLHDNNLEYSNDGLTLVGDHVRVYRRQAANRSLRWEQRCAARRAHLQSLLVGCHRYRHASEWSLALRCITEATWRYGPRAGVLRECAKLPVNYCLSVLGDRMPTRGH